MGRALCATAFAIMLLAGACSGQPTSQVSSPAPPPFDHQLDGDPAVAPAPSVDVNAPSLDLRVIKSMIYSAALEQHLNPSLAMGLGWGESGWNQSAVSSAGAIGIMQIMPPTADSAGPYLLHRHVDIHDINDNIELGCAIIHHNLQTYGGDLVKALADYYGGPALVTDWSHLRPDAQRYVWGIHHPALAFQAGRGPV